MIVNLPVWDVITQHDLTFCGMLVTPLEAKLGWIKFCLLLQCASLSLSFIFYPSLTNPKTSSLSATWWMLLAQSIRVCEYVYIFQYYMISNSDLLLFAVDVSGPGSQVTAALEGLLCYSVVAIFYHVRAVSMSCPLYQCLWQMVSHAQPRSPPCAVCCGTRRWDDGVNFVPWHLRFVLICSGTRIDSSLFTCGFCFFSHTGK